MARIVFTRKAGGRVLVDPTQCPVNEQGMIEFTVEKLSRGWCKVSVDAPRSMRILRGELYDALQREKVNPHPGAQIAADEIEQGNVDLPGDNTP